MPFFKNTHAQTCTTLSFYSILSSFNPVRRFQLCQGFARVKHLIAWLKTLGNLVAVLIGLTLPFSEIEAMVEAF